VKSSPFPKYPPDPLYVPTSGPYEGSRPSGAWTSWRDFCEGMTLAQIEEATGVPWGTILALSMDDMIPWDTCTLLFGTSLRSRGGYNNGIT
jgi:hypothetical protein